MKKSTVLLVDDHVLVREGCRQALEASNFNVVAEAGNADEAYRFFLTHRPQLVVMDLSMENGGGLEAIRRICGKVPSARILVLSMHDDPAIAARAINAGALGYLTKTDSANEFIQAAQKVVAGSPYLSHEIAMVIAITPSGGLPDTLSALTNRELEIFQMLVEGSTTSEISAALSLSPKSVSNSQLRIKQKLNARNLADLVRIAISAGVGKRNFLSASPT